MLCIFNRLKKIIFIFVILILTGCSAKYDITINDKTDIDESLNIIEKDKTKFDENSIELHNATPKEYLQTDLNWPTPVDKDTETSPIEPTEIKGKDYYVKKDISTNSLIGINYNYQFKPKEYSISNILNKCYEFEYEKINNKFIFKTTSDFKCFNEYPLLEDVEFNLNTKCNVIYNNADKTEKEKYTWNITKESVNKKISFSLDCTHKKIENIKIDKRISITALLPIYFMIIGFGILVLKISYKRKNRF